MTDTEVCTGLTAIMRALPAGEKDRRPKPWRKATLDSLSAVEQVLDQLENAGCKEMRVTFVGENFVIRWR